MTHDPHGHSAVETMLRGQAAGIESAMLMLEAERYAHELTRQRAAADEHQRQCHIDALREERDEAVRDAQMSGINLEDTSERVRRLRDELNLTRIQIGAVTDWLHTRAIGETQRAVAAGAQLAHLAETTKAKLRDVYNEDIPF